MGTKNNPGNYDCYEKAEPDEPMFVLLARDPGAPVLVREWASMRLLTGGDYAQIEEAHACATAMEVWYSTHRAQDGSHIVYGAGADSIVGEHGTAEDHELSEAGGDTGGGIDPDYSESAE